MVGFFRCDNDGHSSAYTAKTRVCLGIGGHRLNGHYGLIDARLQVTKLANVKQA